MGWSGGTFTRVHDWTTDAGSAINIEASRMDAEDDNFQGGIDACLHKAGQNAATGNLPMAGNRHTGVGNAAARDDYASAADAQDQDLIYGVATGPANVYVLTLAPAITAYEEGQRFVFRSPAANTGATTLNVSGLGAIAIQTADGSALIANMIVTGGYYEVTYDANGTRFVMTSPHSLIGSVGFQDTINNSDWSGTDLAVANGGTGASTDADARTNLGVAIGSDVQAHDAHLDDLAALSAVGGANQVMVSSGAGAWAYEAEAAFKSSMNLEIGTDVQAWDAHLDDLAALSPAEGANAVMVSTGAGTWDIQTEGTFKSSMNLQSGVDVQAWDAHLDDLAAVTPPTGANQFIVSTGAGAYAMETASSARTSLGLGSLATASSIDNGDWSGTDLAVLNGGTGASDATTARTNLGVNRGNLNLDTDDSPQFAGLNIGHASDTTITRDAAGQIAVEGDAVFSHDSGTYTSGKIFFSSATEPTTEGSNGDIFLVY
jgi:hypothetical protein